MFANIEFNLVETRVKDEGKTANGLPILYYGFFYTTPFKLIFVLLER